MRTWLANLLRRLADKLDPAAIEAGGPGTPDGR